MSESDRPILDEFGRALMEHVRDETISDLQRLISGKMANKQLKELCQALERQELKPEQLEIVGRLLVYAIDSAMASFLQFLDANEIGLLFRGMCGQVHDIQAISDGLAGEPYSEAGWIEQFSKFKAGATIEKLR